MGLFEGFVVYIVLWWIVLFTTLPFAASPDAKPRKGNAESAPANPRLKRKFFLTTLIAALLWVAVYFIITLKLIAIGS